MKTDWLLEPVMQVALLGAFLGVGLIGSLSLWISARLQARAAKKTFDAFRRSTEATLKEMQSTIEELRSEPTFDPAPPFLTTAQGLNLTTRAKALRMHRRGEPIPTIAAALGVQQEEVELLLKLDRLLEAPMA